MRIEATTKAFRDRFGNGVNAMWKWFKRLLSGKPHFVVGSESNPYLLRWYLIPRNRWLNIYLHKFLRDDDDRALHDHPWWFISLMLRGRYREWVKPEPWEVGRFIERSAPSIAFRRAEHRHRVQLNEDTQGNPRPCWTLVVTGPKVREWGFWCPQGFIPWHKFVARGNPGEIGPGCGDDNS